MRRELAVLGLVVLFQLNGGTEPTPQQRINCPPIEADPLFLGQPMETVALVDRQDSQLQYVDGAVFGSAIANIVVVSEHDFITVQRPHALRRAYAIQAYNSRTNLAFATLHSSEYGPLYLLSSIDFGVGGVNFDPVFDHDGNFVGVAGDWSVTWDTGCHLEMPGSFWRGLSLFSSQQTTQYQGSGYLIWESPFNFWIQSFGHHRQVVAGYRNDVFQVFRIDMRERDGSLALYSCYRYGTPEMVDWYLAVFGEDALEYCV